MRISSLLNEDGILLKSKPKSKEEVINTLVECHFRLGNLNDKDSFRKAVLEREASTSTGYAYYASAAASAGFFR